MNKKRKKRYLVIVGVVAAVVLVSILLYTMLANHRPAIISLAAWPEEVFSLQSCQIYCYATDPDEDKLSYNWSASGGNTTGTGESVNWTAPISAGSYNVTVTVTDGRGAEVTDYVTITVMSRPPTITSLVADANWTAPLGSLQVTCNASDPDGDELSYEWTTTGGNITGMGPEVTWTAPQEIGIYNITVVVKDGHGREDTRFVSLSVALGTLPTIENLTVTAKGHIYLRKSTAAGCDYDVWMTKEYDIECIASGTGELFYEWSCDDGQISGAGSKITWTAPDKKSTNTVSVEVTVMVIVSDTAGNRIGKNIVFHVPTCTCGSWG